jgi:hypothetical protein
VSATVPHLWLAHHPVSKAEKTGRLPLLALSVGFYSLYLRTNG